MNNNFPADQYKLYIFACSVSFTEEEQKVVKRLQKNGRVLMWLYASGFYSQDLSGFHLEQSDTDIQEKAEFRDELFPETSVYPMCFAQQEGYVLARFKDSYNNIKIYSNKSLENSIIL